MVPPSATSDASADSVEFAAPKPRTDTVPSNGRKLVIAAYVVGSVGFLIPFVFGPIALILAGIAQGKKFPNAAGALILASVCTIWGMFVLYIGITRDTLG